VHPQPNMDPSSRQDGVLNSPQYCTVQWGTIQNGVFACTWKEISHPPTLIGSQGLKIWSFPMKFLARCCLYVNYMCDKFQGQKIYTKKDIGNLPTCVAVRTIPLLPTLTPFQGLNFFLFPWNFLHKTIYMLITCVKIFKFKRYAQKKYLISTNVCRCEENFTTANFDTLPSTEKMFFCLEFFGMRPSLCW